MHEGRVQVIIKEQKDTLGVENILILILVMLSWMFKYGKIANCTIKCYSLLCQLYLNKTAKIVLDYIIGMTKHHNLVPDLATCGGCEKQIVRCRGTTWADQDLIHSSQSVPFSTPATEASKSSSP